MSCYSCGGNPSTFCRECNYPKDTWIAPVDKLPDTFMGDFDHLFRTPDGNLYALAPERDRWIRVNGEAGNAVSYNDTELKKRITALEGRTDNFVSGIGVSREGSKVKLTYTFIDGTHKEVEFEDKDTKSIAYDDSALKARVSALETKTDKDTVYDDSSLKARVKTLEDKPDRDNQSLTFNGTTGELSISNGNTVTIPSDKQTISKQGNRLVLSNGGGEIDLPTPKDSVPYDDTTLRNRVKALEDRPDRDNQTLSLDGNKLKLANGGEVNLEKYDTPVLRIHKGIITTSAVEHAVTYITPDSLANKDGVKIGDIVQDIISYPSGGGEVNYWKVTNANDFSIELKYLNSDNIGVYNDGELKKKIDALEKRPIPTNDNTPVHRFYDGDIPGRADTNTVKTVPKSGFRNPDGLKVGDTVEDYWSDRNTINRGIWKVTEISGNNVKVQGIGNYDANIRRNISFNANTRVLSIDEGGSVTLPNDKQTISKNGNKIVLSNGGGEVDIPTATPYNDADIKRRLGVLEAKPDNDKQTLSISGNTLSISNGNSVNIPQPNLSGYVPIDEYNKLKGALEKLLTDLKGSGAWRQTGATVFEGSLDPNRHLATGNINLFGGTTDGNAFIRTNNGSTENDLAGGIG